MNKITFTFLVLVGIGQSYAQPSFGIKAGVNRNAVTLKSTPFLPMRLYQPNLGFHFGGFARINLGDKFSFNPELLFVQRGAHKNPDGLFGALQPSVGGRINLNYIELPLLLAFNPINFLSFEIGPSGSMKVSAKETSSKGKIDVSDQFDKSFDAGINAGIKVNLSNKISIVGRYYHGLRSVIRFENIYPNDPPATSANKTLQVGIHYLLTE